MGYVAVRDTLLNVILRENKSHVPMGFVSYTPTGELYYKLVSTLYANGIRPTEYCGSVLYLSYASVAKLRSIIIEINTDATVNTLPTLIYWCKYMPLKIKAEQLPEALDFTAILCESVTQALQKEPCPYLFIPDKIANRIDIQSAGIVVYRSKISMWIGDKAKLLASEYYTKVYESDGV